MSDPSRGFDTRAVHAGEPRPLIHGAVVAPIFQSATFESGGEEGYHGIRYARLSNTPTHVALHEKLAALEGAEAAVSTASGMAAISTALLAFLEPGDRLLIQEGLYGGTHDLVAQDLPALGIGVDFVDGERPETWEQRLTPRTRVFYLEALSNPLMRVPDLQAGAAFARAHGLVSMVDNTFPSPFNFRPPERGFDLSLHSATKYLNGHSDLVAGAVVGGAEHVERVRKKLNHLGGSLDPHAAFLLARGVKTLGVRMRQHNASALELARFLERHPAVARVHHPGLESSPSFARAAALFDGTSGMLAFELAGGLPAAERVLARVRLPISAPSLGGVESLITLPARTSHSGMPPDERRRIGIADGLVRLSVGLEDPADLIADLDHALEG